MAQRRLYALGLVVLVGGTAWGQTATAPLAEPQPAIQPAVNLTQAAPAPSPAPARLDNFVVQAPDDPPSEGDGSAPPAVAAPAPGEGESAGAAAEQEGGYGPAPAQKMTLLQNWLRELCGKGPLGDNLKPKDATPECANDPCLRIFGWMDFDYTYRSTGPGLNTVAPVMNRFGDEALDRQNGLAISKLLDPKELSWGFNSILIVGSDAAFLNPTQGWFGGSNLGPGGSDRYGISFTDLNLTAHLPILTEDGVDVKAGRQTSILGPMGALSWQRWFDSSDYAWYDLEEGRYTGVSSTWHVTKQFDWYNGFELGWGTFFAPIGYDVDYITNLSYWLDEKKQKTRLWTTLLTGPTSQHSGKFTTTLELAAQHNWNDYVYQIWDTQMDWSKGPVDAIVPPGYLERAYDAYTYLGCHLNKQVDLNSRWEYYKDVDGGGYAGGFGVPHTTYLETTIGINYHPTKWVQFRPEIRYDHADHENLGPDHDRKNQLSIGGDVLLQF